MVILVATDREVVVIDGERAMGATAHGIDGRPTIDPEQADVVVVSASSGPYSAYVAGRSDGRLYRRLTRERWEPVHDGWPQSATTIAPLLCAGEKIGELWAADERGVHRTDDGGKRWQRVVDYATSPQHLRGLALVP